MKTRPGTSKALSLLIVRKKGLQKCPPGVRGKSDPAKIPWRQSGCALLSPERGEDSNGEGRKEKERPGLFGGRGRASAKRPSHYGGDRKKKERRRKEEIVS